jgi:DNA-binding transcriptional MerR regulator
MSQRIPLLVLVASLACSGRWARAQNLQADQQAYCSYISEQAKAQSDLLRTPNALGGFTQPDTGLPTQVVAGASLNIANLRRAGLTLEEARKNCDDYKASTDVQLMLQYSISSLEKDALSHRLTLIEQASQSLNALIDQTTKMIAAGNMTRPMLQALVGDRIKLESDRADTESKIAALYVPLLSSQPLKQQVATKQAGDVEEQRTQANLQRQNNWDVALSVGMHQQVNPAAGGPEPYGQVTVSYNLASRAIDRHLDRSITAYSDWKKVQEGDAARGMEILRGQVEGNIAAQQKRLESLQRETGVMNKDLQLTSNADTSASLDYHNQLAATKLLLGIETGDAAYRLEYLRGFLSSNF